MHKQILIFLFFIFTSNVLSQTEKNPEKSILIYNEGQAYLQSFIEKSITNLINVDSESPYFSSVNSFNRIYSSNKYKAQLNDLIRTQKDNSESSDLYYSKEEKIQRKEIFNILNNYDYFLTINTNTLGELIEFQFQLFETIPPKENTGSTLNKVISTENFFINPKDEKCYSVIEQSLQRLFTKSNRLPEAELNIYGKLFKEGTTNNNINLPINSTVIFDGSNSGDFDNENISYIWRNITHKNEKYQTSKKILFKQDLAKQAIVIGDSGKYRIGFKVYDGVNYSNEIVLNINAQEELQKTLMLDSIKYSVNYSGLFTKSNFKRTHQQTFFCEKLIENDSLRNNVIITTTPIQNKYAKYIDKSIIYNSYRFDKYLKLDYKNYFSKIEIESTFDNFKNPQDEKIYYVYDLNNEGLAYNQRIIKHKLRNREIFNCGLRYEYALILDKDRDQNQKKEFDVISFSLLLNFLLTSKLELEISIPYPSKNNLGLENTNIQYPGLYNIGLRYFIIDLNKNQIFDFKPYIIFQLKSLTNKGLINTVGVTTSNIFCYTPGLGIEKTIKNLNIFDLNFRFGVNYGFFNDQYLKNYNFYSYNVDCVFRF